MILKKFISFLFLYIVFINTAAADNKVAYIDVDLILSKSKVGSNLLSKLNQIDKNKIDELKLIEEKLINEKKKIMGSKNLVTNKDFNLSINNFQKKLEKYDKNKSNVIKDLKNNRNKEISKLLNLITPFVEKYMEKNEITILLDKKKVFIAQSDYDISKFIIEIIDKNLKATNIE